MMKVFIIAILTTVSVNANCNLIGSIWTHKIADGCIDTLQLKTHGKIIEYSCEMNYTFQGTYRLSKNTLIITEKDDSHSEDGGKVEYYKAKYLIRQNALYILGNGKLNNGKWEYDKVRLTKSLWYKRLK